MENIILWKNGKVLKNLLFYTNFVARVKFTLCVLLYDRQKSNFWTFLYHFLKATHLWEYSPLKSTFFIDVFVSAISVKLPVLNQCLFLFIWPFGQIRMKLFQFCLIKFVQLVHNFPTWVNLDLLFLILFEDLSKFCRYFVVVLSTQPF